MTCSTVHVHVERFVKTKNKKETRKWYAKYLRPMEEYFGADRLLTTVTRAEAEDYWESIQERSECWESHPYKPTEVRTLSITTQANHLRAARYFWSEMVRQKVVEDNPFDHLKIPRNSNPAKSRAIKPNDLMAIWKVSLSSSKRDFALITVLATTGVRASELVSMSLRDMDLAEGTIGVTGKTGWREVILGKASVQAIQEYLQERSDSSCSALWVGCRGEPLTSDGVRRLVYRLADQAHIVGRHNLHAFRHRVAQSWLDEGINAEIVMQILGHANVTTTLAIYGNQDIERTRKAMEKAELAPFHARYGLNGPSLTELFKTLND